MASSAEGPLAGRGGLITGGSSGIGLAAARVLAGAGARLVLVARGRARLEAEAARLGAAAAAADVADAGAVARLAGLVERALGGTPDFVVNAAGAFELAAVAEATVESFDRQVGVNLRAPFLLARAFLPAMLVRGSGHLLTVGSVAGRQGFPHNGAYAASKFGVRGLHAVLDAELRGTGVRATLVEPAATDTPLWDGVEAGVHPGLPPREAMLRPESVADAVLFALTRPAEVDLRVIVVERT